MPTPSVRLVSFPITLAVMALALASGCGREEPKPAAQPAPAPVAKSAPAPAAQPAPPPAQPAPPAASTPAPAAPQAAPAAAPVLASAQYTDDPNLRCDLLEVKRVSGGALMIRWRLVNTASQAGGLAAAKPEAIGYDIDYNWVKLYYIDPAENKKYSFLTDSAGNRILDIRREKYTAGQQRVNWAKFPAPPATSKKITIYIPFFPPFDDIPVAE